MNESPEPREALGSKVRSKRYKMELMRRVLSLVLEVRRRPRRGLDPRKQPHTGCEAHHTRVFFDPLSWLDTDQGPGTSHGAESNSRAIAGPQRPRRMCASTDRPRRQAIFPMRHPLCPKPARAAKAPGAGTGAPQELSMYNDLAGPWRSGDFNSARHRDSVPLPAKEDVIVQIDLVCGGLSNVKVPVVIAGRYDGLPIAGATKAFDRLLDSWLTRAVDLGLVGSGLGQLFPHQSAKTPGGWKGQHGQSAAGQHGRTRAICPG